MISNNLNSQFVLIGSVTPPNNQSTNFGQNVQWLSNDLFGTMNNLIQPYVTEPLNFSDGTYFDGGSTEFGEFITTGSQQLSVYQVLKTDREWINNVDDIIFPTPVNTINI